MNQRPEIRNGTPEQSCSMAWAGLQEKIQPKEKCFLLDSFYRTNQELVSPLLGEDGSDGRNARRASGSKRYQMVKIPNPSSTKCPTYGHSLCGTSVHNRKITTAE